MRIACLALLLIVVLNFGNPCPTGYRFETPAGCSRSAGLLHCPARETAAPAT